MILNKYGARILEWRVGTSSWSVQYANCLECYIKTQVSVTVIDGYNLIKSDYFLSRLTFILSEMQSNI